MQHIYFLNFRINMTNKNAAVKVLMHLKHGLGWVSVVVSYFFLFIVVFLGECPNSFVNMLKQCPALCGIQFFSCRSSFSDNRF